MPPRREWPAPGEPAFPTSAYDPPTRAWLGFLERALQRRGLWARRMRSLPAAPTACCLLRSCPCVGGGNRTVSNLVPYFVHAPVLVLWIRAQRAKGLPTPRYLWAVEEDTPLIGRLALPLLHYRTSPADLIAVYMPHTHANARTRTLYTNARFRAARDVGRVFVHMWEHVERVSARLLERLDAILTEGEAAFGEFLLPTICASTPWCTCAELRDGGFVQRQGSLFSYSQPIARPVLRRLLDFVRDRPAMPVARWVHGVQGACDVLAAVACGHATANGGNASVACTLPAVAGEQPLWIRDTSRRPAHRPKRSERAHRQRRLSESGAPHQAAVGAADLSHAATSSNASCVMGDGSCACSKRPRIFIYPSPLPPWFKAQDHRLLALRDRIATSVHHVVDGACADFFVISNQADARNGGRSNEMVVAMYEHLASRWPYWNATNGYAQHGLEHSTPQPFTCCVSKDPRDRLA